MAHHLSEPVETLIDESGGDPVTDVLIVGSGYGGAVAAMRLANAEGGRCVYVLERGKEYVPGDFPEGLGELPGHVQFRRPTDRESIGYADGLFDFRLGDDVDVLVGSGLGGTSLINANVVEEPEPAVFQQPCWPQAIRHEAVEADSALAKAFANIRELLGVAPGSQTNKYRALSRLATSAGLSCRAATIAVTVPAASLASDSAARLNAVGIHQSACTQCGNCVTGCNVGAKNTLPMNLIPMAKTRGARFFTGATVIALERNEQDSAHPWVVRFRRTATTKTPLAEETYRLRSSTVILAAGTLGSTEILLRTQAQTELRFSPMLGARFSTNGDAIAMGFGQSHAVNALGRDEQNVPAEVGPTICGISKATWTDPRTRATIRLTIEDASIPAALTDVFGEIATTGAQLHRLSSFDLPAWLAKKNVHGVRPDPIAVHKEALEHSQVLLLMGDDGASGRLELACMPDWTLEDAQVKVVWPDARDNPALRCADALLSSQDYGPGFDGGQYVPNPLWRLLPARAASVMSGKVPDGRVITVHPLGGCPMGEDPRSGVVDHAGQVFCWGNSGKKYDGLYVLDGSIVPAAISVNPLLTISALAWRACGILLTRHGWSESSRSRVSGEWSRAPDRPDVRPYRAPPAVAVAFHEQLIGQLDCSPERLRGLLPVEGVERWCGFNGLVMQTEVSAEDLRRWLNDPGALPLPARVRLYANPIPAADMQRTHLSHVTQTHLAGRDPLVTLEGKVTLFRRETTWWLIRYWRAAKAIWAYFKRRQSIGNVLRQEFVKYLAKDDKSAGAGTHDEISLWEKLKGYVAVALMQAEYRTMDYHFGPTDMPGDIRLEIMGRKRLAWATDNPRVWDALLNLPVQFTVTRAGKPDAVGGTLTFDLEYVATGGLPQVLQSPHLPASLAAIGGFGMLFLRALFQTNFWEFGAPQYPSQPVVQRPEPRPLKLPDGTVINPETTQLQVPLADGDPRTVPIALTRYPSRATNADPVLLIHGLAQGSLIYCTDTLEKNLASALWEAGYDVWLLDHRLSNALIRSIPLSGWSMEEIARYDVCAAVEHVYNAAGRRPLRVFAHCVGATATAMAVLKKWVLPEQLAKVAFNAIHPWITTSPVNRFRAIVGALFRESVVNELLDPVPQVNPTAAQAFLDRLAFSAARYGEEAQDKHPADGKLALSKAICDRMSFFYGRMWRHANLDDRTHTAFADLVGPAPAEVYRHLYYFSKRGRLTDRDGQNVFLTESNIVEGWRFQTLFFHGEMSNVFNPQSATDSATRFSMVQTSREERFEVAKTQFGVRRVKGYGHMDVIFAAGACSDVYPAVAAFFAGGNADSAQAVPSDRFAIDSIRYSRIARSTSCGPILRSAWIENGRICLRLWVELYDASTAPVRGVNVISQEEVVEPLRDWHVEGSEPSYRLVDVRVMPHAYHIRLGVAPSREERHGVDTYGQRQGEGKSDPEDRHRPPERHPPVPDVDGLGRAQHEGKVEAEALRRPIMRQGAEHHVDTHGRQRHEGTFTPDVPLPSPTAAGWGEMLLRGELTWLQRLRQRVNGDPASDVMSFLVGSCRYPGTPFEYRAADAVFGGMLRHVISDGAKAPGVDAVFFVGDQIYADATASILDAKAWRERYSQRYRDAFTSTSLWELLRTVPIHFAVDDHEFADEWSGLPFGEGGLRQNPEAEKKHAHARRAACSYLSSGRESVPIPRLSGSHGALWYALSHECETVCPAFVMDTRSERNLRRKNLLAEMISPEQWHALESWLQDAHTNRPGHPKFIFSGSVLAPVRRDLLAHGSLWKREDGWAGYPATLGRLVAMIVEKRIRNVVFVGGDLHLSALAHLTLHKRGEDPVTAWQIVASGLYSPLPFANTQPAAFDWNTDCVLPIADGTTSITAHAGLMHAGLPQFVRVDVSHENGKWTLTISANGADGEPLPGSTSPPHHVRAEGKSWVISL